jgi:hypothetical protein
VRLRNGPKNVNFLGPLPKFYRLRSTGRRA